MLGSLGEKTILSGGDDGADQGDRGSEKQPWKG